MKSDRDRVELLFDLMPEGDWPPVAKECLIFSKDAEGYRVEVPPFFVGGISVGDVLSIDDGERGNVVSWAQIRASERSTVWVMFFGDFPYAEEIKCLQELGCNVEELKRFRYISIDVPEISIVDKVDDCLAHLNEEQVAIAYPSLREG